MVDGDARVPAIGTKHDNLSATDRSDSHAFEPRAMMERAVEVMKASQAEKRADGKACPLVGAVLVKSDGSVDTAYRGELREGDHAEYALLERKNRSARLDDAILFTTLEPCALGSRTHPKLSCAERIVLARIKAVWIGVEDPDPKVDRKGIKYLQEHGVSVHMFARDLQEVILAANRGFIEQAMERAAAARETPAPRDIVLSDLERRLERTSMSDLDQVALKRYAAASRFVEAPGTTEFDRRLAQQGLVEESDGQPVPTGYGWILFGKEPRLRMPQAALLATVHLLDGREETRDFDGPAVEIPQQAISWLKDKLPNPIDRGGAERREANAVFFELVREGVANALVHRDYGIKGAKCQISAAQDRIDVMSPGGPIAPITLEQLRAFDAPMLSRNPLLHFVFAKMKLAEERGLGLKSMRVRAGRAGLPLPEYSFKDPYVVLSVFRAANAAVAPTKRPVLDELSDAERAGWDWLVTKDAISAADYQKAMGLPNRTARNHLVRFVKLGLLRQVGSARATRYEVNRS